jgi:peroxiredoxin
MKVRRVPVHLRLFMKGRMMAFRLIAIPVIAAVLVLTAGESINAGDEASREFNSIIATIQRAGKSGSPYQFVDTAERLLYDFLKRHPGTKEAAKAHLTLGQVYAQIQRNEEAVEHISLYLQADVERVAKEESFARFILAGAYVAMENFDKAEALYKEVVNSPGGIDRRIVNAAAKELARVGTLRRLTIGSPAVDFAAITTDGKKLRLADYRGKVVLLDFWASWCVPCKQEMPNVKKVYQEYHGKGFEIIGVSLDKTKTNCMAYVRNQKLPWKQIYDGQAWLSEIGQKYAVSAIPATFLLDRKGKIRFKNLRGSDLGEAVKELIEEE